MRKNSLIILLCLLLCTVSCAPWQVGAEKDVVKNGMEFETFKEEEDGSKLGILAGETVIDGYPCRKGFVVFHPDWRPDELQLSRDHERNGIAMPAGTWVFPNDQGNPGVCMFPRDIEIQGMPCRGSRMGKSGVMTSFHDSGALKHFFTRDPLQVDGVLCRGGVFGPGIHLHENGRLAKCELAGDAVVEGVVYRKGSTLRLAPAGNVLE